MTTKSAFRSAACAAAIFVIFSAMAPALKAQGIAEAPAAPLAETLVQRDPTQSTGSLLRSISPKTLFASVKLRSTAPSKLDYDHVVYGPVPEFRAGSGVGGSWYICTSVSSVDARYFAFVPFEVFGPTKGMEMRRVPRASSGEKTLSERQLKEIDEAYHSGNVLVRSILAPSCSGAETGFMVATGFAQSDAMEGDIFLDMFLALESTISLDLVLTSKETGTEFRPDCEVVERPTGYECTLRLNKLDAVGDFNVVATLQHRGRETSRTVVLGLR